MELFIGTASAPKYAIRENSTNVETHVITYLKDKVYLKKFGCAILLLLLQSAGLNIPRNVCGVSVLDLQAMNHSEANHKT